MINIKYFTDNTTNVAGRRVSRIHYIVNLEVQMMKNFMNNVSLLNSTKDFTKTDE